jgi:hypothetical protein
VVAVRCLGALHDDYANGRLGESEILSVRAGGVTSLRARAAIQPVRRAVLQESWMPGQAPLLSGINRAVVAVAAAEEDLRGKRRLESRRFIQRSGARGRAKVLRKCAEGG